MCIDICIIANWETLQIGKDCKFGLRPHELNTCRVHPVICVNLSTENRLLTSLAFLLCFESQRLIKIITADGQFTLYSIIV